MALETGPVVCLRNRHWRIDRITTREVFARPLDGRDTRQWCFLRSLEEPNVKPEALPPPMARTVGGPAFQDMLQRTQGLNFAHDSAPFIGLQRSRDIPGPYQLVPLMMALEMAPIRLLIGNDARIRKTVEAGLLRSEPWARETAERLLVVVPASPGEPWQESVPETFRL